MKTQEEKNQFFLNLLRSFGEAHRGHTDNMRTIVRDFLTGSFSDIHVRSDYAFAFLMDNRKLCAQLWVDVVGDWPGAFRDMLSAREEC